MTDAAGYPWDVLGRFEYSSGDVHVTEIWLRPTDSESHGTKPLEPELIRRLTRVQPIKTRVKKRVANLQRELNEAKSEVEASGRSLEDLGVLADWVRELGDAKRKLKPWRSRYPDSDWADWAMDYLDRVRSNQSTWGVLRKIADEGAWGTRKYETIRARTRRMRDYEWIVGEGHLVEEGPRLLRWLNERKDANDG